MKTIFAKLSMLLALSLTSQESSACSHPDPPEFVAFADAAPLVFVAKVISMRLVREPITFDDGHQGECQAIESEISVEKNLRGNANQFKKVRYINWSCAGSDIKLGHLYLVATEQTGELLELDFKTVAIGDITPFDTLSEAGPFSIDIASNEFVLEAERGLREHGKFSGTFLDHLRHPYLTVSPVEVSIEIPKTKKASHNSNSKPTKANASPP